MRPNLLFLSGFLLAKVYGQCSMEGIIPVRHDDIYNYVIDNFDGGHFPFALNQCTAISALPSQKWYKYTCNDDNGEWSITKTEYTDANCTGEGEIITDWEEDLEGLEKFFECDGADAYVQIELSVENPCENSVTIYAGLGSCIKSTTSFGEFELFCNETTTLIHFFEDSMQSTTPMPMSTTFMPMTTTELQMSTTEMQMTTTEMEIVTTENTDLNISDTLFPALNLSSTEMPDTTQINVIVSTPFFPTLDAASTIINTIISSIIDNTFPSNMFTTSQAMNMCNDKNYCELWVLPRSECSLASTSAFEDTQVYAKMVKCGISASQGSTTSTSVLETTKSASIPVPLVINGVLSLLFALYWI